MYKVCVIVRTFFRRYIRVLDVLAPPDYASAVFDLYTNYTLNTPYHH